MKSWVGYSYKSSVTHDLLPLLYNSTGIPTLVESTSLVEQECIETFRNLIPPG